MILKCNNTECKLKDSCYRYSSEATNIFNPKFVECPHYWEKDFKPVKQIR